jgi:hypothetical protein
VVTALGNLPDSKGQLARHRSRHGCCCKLLRAPFALLTPAAGWNGWRLLEYALDNPSYISAKFKQANTARLNMLRFFVAGNDGGKVLFPSPGEPQRGRVGRLHLC